MLAPILVLRAVWAELRLESAKAAMASIGECSELCPGSQPKDTESTILPSHCLPADSVYSDGLSFTAYQGVPESKATGASAGNDHLADLALGCPHAGMLVSPLKRLKGIARNCKIVCSLGSKLGNYQAKTDWELILADNSLERKPHDTGTVWRPKVG